MGKLVHIFDIAFICVVIPLCMFICAYEEQDIKGSLFDMNHRTWIGKKQMTKEIRIFFPLYTQQTKSS